MTVIKNVVFRKTLLKLACIGMTVVVILGHQASATVVHFDTVLGEFDVRLFNRSTPQTVANFVDNYVIPGAYTDTFFHRNATTGTGDPFVLQAGGFTFPNDTDGVQNIVTSAPVQNEPGISNLRGTIAMAKLGGDPDSATSQFFFNLGDNSANLDNQNGGFTVFGRVLFDGMDVIDAIAALPNVNASGAFNTLPVRNYTSGQILKENLAIISSVTVLSNPDGDYDFDGDVDGADFLVWQSTRASQTELQADGNGNANVNNADFDIWASEFGTSNAAFATGAATAVPEPASIVLLLSAAFFAWASRKRAKN